MPSTLAMILWSAAVTSGGKVTAADYSAYLPAERAAAVISALKKATSARESVLFDSAESTALTGSTITNRVQFARDGALDVWLMRQRQAAAEGDKPENWSLVGLVVDRAAAPRAYFLEFAPEPVRGLPRPIAPRVPCVRCHANGPRLIRPDARGPAPDAATLRRFNAEIAQAGVIDAYFPPGVRLTDARSGNDALPLPGCTQCHDPVSGIRSALSRQHAGSILYLTTHDAMPLDDAPLSAQDRTCLDDWLRKKPLPPACLAARPAAVGGINTAAATVSTTLGGFTARNLRLRTSLDCPDARACAARILVGAAAVDTGIAVRDRHLREFLRATADGTVARIDVPLMAWPNLTDTATIAVQVTVAGVTRTVDAAVACGADGRCAVDAVWDFRAFGLRTPGFLGIRVDPRVAVHANLALPAAARKYSE